MASYKPKSLDELNDMYGKEISAQKAIAKGSSKISGKDENGFLAEETKADFLNSSDFQKEIFDVSAAVDEFIKKYPSAQRTADNSPVHRSPVQPAPSNVPVAVPQARTKTAGEGGISSLMSDYAKIMSDQDDGEDDEEFFRKGLKRRKKNKRKQAQEPTAELQQEIPEIQEPTDVPPEPQPQAEPLPEPEKELPEEEISENYDDAYSQSENYSEDEELPPLDLFYDEASPEEVPAKNSGGRIALRVIFSVLFALSILATMAVASVNTVLNVNTGKIVFGQYSFFTSSHDFEEAGVHENELVICKKAETLSVSDKVVFVDYDAGVFSFGVCTKVPAENSSNGTYTVSGSEVQPVNVLGEINKTVPKLGKIIGAVMNNFIMLLCALAVISVLFLIIVVFVLRNKNNAIQEAEENEVLIENFEKSAESEEYGNGEVDIFDNLDE